MQHADPSPAARFERVYPIRFSHCDPAGIVFFPQYLVLFNHLVEDWFTEGLGVDYAQMLGARRIGLPAVRGSDYAPGLAFLALLQASALVLNLLPLPGFDGYGALWPYLPRDVRAVFDRYANYAMLALFLLLFLVPPVARAFWGLVALLTHAAGIPLGLAQVGYGEFKFWD